MAQELPQVIPPSPTVANLMHFEEVPISYYTGQPNISIPIYSKQLNSDLSMNIALFYNTQGVKIDNISGWTGTGWSLMAGGSISRTVRDLPDEISPTNSSHSKKGIYHQNDYWIYLNQTGTESIEYNYNVLKPGEADSKNDSKPDLYQFNFMGYSGRFIVFKENGGLKAKFITKNTPFKVEITHHNTEYDIIVFKFTDPKGYVYTFDAIESSIIEPYSLTYHQGDGSGSFVGGESSYNANTAWHLTKIETSNMQPLVTLSYITDEEGYKTPPSLTTNDIISVNGIENHDVVRSQYNQNVLEPKWMLSYEDIDATTKKLQSIYFTKDNVQVQFDADSSIHPVTNGSVLRAITIKCNSDIDKIYQFNYQDIIGDLSSSNLSRLWLTNIKETTATTNYDYNLYYRNKQNLPPAIPENTNPSHNYYFEMEDDWGYFSGLHANHLYPFSKNTILTGLLTSIEYPTGGIKEFNFEHNTFSYYQNQTLQIEDYLENPENVNNQTVSNNNFNQTYSNSTNSGFIFGNINISHIQDIYISSLLTVSESGDLSDHFIEISNTNNTFSLNIYSLNNNSIKIKNIPTGTYNFRLKRLVGNRDIYSVIGSFKLDYKSMTQSLKEEMIGGGVRIKTIKFKDNDKSTTYERIIRFEYNDEHNLDLSSGVIDSKADRLIKNYKKTLNRTLFWGIDECLFGGFFERNVTYQVRQKQVNLDLTQSSYVGYRHIKVFETNNGYKTYSYTSPFEYYNELDTFDYEEPRPRENLDYKRGLPLKEVFYNQSGKLLKSISYIDDNNNPNYIFDESQLLVEKSFFTPNCALWQFTSSYYNYANGIVSGMPECASHSLVLGGFDCGELLPKIRPFNSGWAKLKGTTTKEYFYDVNGNQSVTETRQEFKYNPHNYQISEQDTYYNESGTEQHNKTKYFYSVGSSLSSNSSDIKNALVNLNKVNEVLETQTFLNGNKLNEQHTIYHEFHPNVVLPKEVKVAKQNDSPNTRIEFINYDTYGNPLEVSKSDGTHIIYVWGYNDTQPIAKIENASYDDLDTAQQSAIDAVKLASNSDIDTCMGISGCTEANLRDALNTLRDVFPKSMVTTYTYNPLVGVTSITDPRGQTVYYKYDEFNRLKHVKDKDGNILSENQYNYRTED